MATAKKDSIAVQIGARIKQARAMAGFNTQAGLVPILLEQHTWGKSKLGMLESGQTRAGIEEAEILEAITGASACWLLFGNGPIRDGQRDVQAIRHQNLVHAVNELKKSSQHYKTFLTDAESNESAITKFLNDPFRKIGDRQARRFERALKRARGWFDQQHVETDPVCAHFPKKMQELMSLYSEMNEEEADKALEMMRIMAGK